LITTVMVADKQICHERMLNGSFRMERRRASLHHSWPVGRSSADQRRPSL